MAQCARSGSSLRRLSLGTAFAAWLVLGGCSNARTTAGESGASDTLRLDVQPIEALTGVSGTGIGEPIRQVLRSEPEWQRFWSRLAAGTIPPPQPPAVDFEQRMVIVAAMGMKPTGGYAIAIEEVGATADNLYISVVETSPGTGCLTTQALTAPVAAVTVERHPGAPVFREREEVRDCG